MKLENRLKINHLTASDAAALSLHICVLLENCLIRKVFIWKKCKNTHGHKWTSRSPLLPPSIGTNGQTYPPSSKFQKREIPWDKVPFVPRPSLVPDPVTAFGKRKPDRKVDAVGKLVLTPGERAKIRPKVLLEPVRPYVSARDSTREKVFDVLRRRDLVPKELPSSDAMDVVLPRLHKVAEQPNLPYKRRLVLLSDLPPVYWK